MISVHVSAVCLVRDGYTGQIIQPSTLLCTVDGVPCRPVSKPEGYLVLTGLDPGPHRLILRAAGFQEEWFPFTAGEDPGRVLSVTMKPGVGYRFRRPAVRLRVTVQQKKLPVPEHCLWLAAPSRLELKVAQTKVESGEQTVRLYWKGQRFPTVPGSYFLQDGASSEIVELRALDGETGRLETPLKKSHKRGIPLLSAQRYHTDEAGTLQAVFQSAATIALYEETTGLVDSITLVDGENEYQVSLPAGKSK